MTAVVLLMVGRW